MCPMLQDKILNWKKIVYIKIFFLLKLFLLEPEFNFK